MMFQLTTSLPLLSKNTALHPFSFQPLQSSKCSGPATAKFYSLASGVLLLFKSVIANSAMLPLKTIRFKGNIFTDMKGCSKIH